MDDEKWEIFHLATKAIVDDKFFDEMKIYDQTDLTMYWEDISRALLKVAIQTIDNHMTPATSKEFKPKKLTAAYKEIKNINKFINVLRPTTLVEIISNFNYPGRPSAHSSSRSLLVTTIQLIYLLPFMPTILIWPETNLKI